MECPLVYSGKGGVCKKGFQLGSMYLLITVSGRTTLNVYLASQQAIKASIRAKETAVYVYTVLSKLVFLFWQIIPVIPIQWPPGVMALVAYMVCPTTFSLKPLQSQKLQMAFCSLVRLLPVSCTCLAIL